MDQDFWYLQDSVVEIVPYSPRGINNDVLWLYQPRQAPLKWIDDDFDDEDEEVYLDLPLIDESGAKDVEYLDAFNENLDQMEYIQVGEDVLTSDEYYDNDLQLPDINEKEYRRMFWSKSGGSGLQPPAATATSVGQASPGSVRSIRLQTFKMSGEPLPSARQITLPFDQSTSTADVAHMQETAVDDMVTLVSVHRASDEGMTLRLRQLLDQEDQPVQGSAWTRAEVAPLHLAAGKGHRPVSRVLVQHGAGLEEQSSKTNRTPLHLAAYHNRASMVRELCKKQVQVDAEDYRHYSPLCLAAHTDAVEAARELLRHGASKQQRAAGGLTPLLIAVKEESVATAIVLADGEDAGINMVDDSKRNGLHWAAFTGNMPLVLLLLSRGTNAGVLDMDGHRPIDVARRRQHDDVVEVLDNAMRGRSLYPVATVHQAAMVGANDILRDLLAQGASVVGSEQTKYELSPLHLSCTHGHVETSRILLDHGADANGLTDRLQRTPLHAAAKANQAAVIRMLGAEKSTPVEVEAVDSTGLTPLMLAAKVGATEAVCELLPLGADTTATSEREQETPLHLACKHGHGETAAVLANSRRGPELVDRTDAFERTPLHWAAFHGDMEAVLALLEAGAFPRPLDSSGRTPAMIARACGHVDVAEVLEGWTHKPKRKPVPGVPFPRDYQHPPAYESDTEEEVIVQQHARAASIMLPGIPSSYQLPPGYESDEEQEQPVVMAVVSRSPPKPSQEQSGPSIPTEYTHAPAYTEESEQDEATYAAAEAEHMQEAISAAYAIPSKYQKPPGYEDNEAVPAPTVTDDGHIYDVALRHDGEPVYDMAGHNTESFYYLPQDATRKQPKQPVAPPRSQPAPPESSVYETAVAAEPAVYGEASRTQAFDSYDLASPTKGTKVFDPYDMASPSSEPAAIEPMYDTASRSTEKQPSPYDMASSVDTQDRLYDLAKGAAQPVAAEEGIYDIAVDSMDGAGMQGGGEDVIYDHATPVPAVQAKVDTAPYSDLRLPAGLVAAANTEGLYTAAIPRSERASLVDGSAQDDREDAALKIQSAFRGRKARQSVKELKEEKEQAQAATKIQAVFRGRKARQSVQGIKAQQAPVPDRIALSGSESESDDDDDFVPPAADIPTRPPTGIVASRGASRKEVGHVQMPDFSKMTTQEKRKAVKRIRVLRMAARLEGRPLPPLPPGMTDEQLEAMAAEVSPVASPRPGRVRFSEVEQNTARLNEGFESLFDTMDSVLNEMDGDE